MTKTAIVVTVALAAVSCGGGSPTLGIAVDRIGIEKNRLGDSPPDLPTRQFVSPNELARAVRADVLGDDEPEVLVPAANGMALEIRDRAGAQLQVVPTREYITDFGAVPSPTSGKQDLVLYLYPNEEQGGTFQVMSADREERATWKISPPVARFTVGDWQGAPALFYLQSNTIEVRTPAGEALAQLSAPGGEPFESLQLLRTSGKLVVLASGNGYNPYHMVCIYDGAGQLVFQERDDEHAFALDPGQNPSTFIVSTRSSRWEYAMRVSAP